MKILIQHNFRTGLGDMYNDMVEYMTTVQKYKDLGWEIHLVYCLFTNKYVTDKIFHEIFDQETTNFFTSVQETFSPITEKEYQGFSYVYSAHQPQFPGTHRWDIFSDEPIDSTTPYRIPPNLFRLFPHDNVTKPQFNEDLIDKAKEFSNQIGSDYNFIHIRTMDSEKNEQKYNHLKNNFTDFFGKNNGIFHLGTNNKFLDENLRNLSNIRVFKFTHLDSADNELNAVTNKNIKNEILIERFKETIIEMISIRFCKHIYSYSDYGWISLFLLYGILEGGLGEKNYTKIHFNNG